MTHFVCWPNHGLLFYPRMEGRDSFQYSMGIFTTRRSSTGAARIQWRSPSFDSHSCSYFSSPGNGFLLVIDMAKDTTSSLLELCYIDIRCYTSSILFTLHTFSILCFPNATTFFSESILLLKLRWLDEYILHILYS